jgi:hypothetical protein
MKPLCPLTSTAALAAVDLLVEDATDFFISLLGEARGCSKLIVVRLMRLSLEGGGPEPIVLPLRRPVLLSCKFSCSFASISGSAGCGASEVVGVDGLCPSCTLLSSLGNAIPPESPPARLHRLSKLNVPSLLRPTTADASLSSPFSVNGIPARALAWRRSIGPGIVRNLTSCWFGPSSLLSPFSTS